MQCVKLTHPVENLPRRWVAYPRWPFISIVVCVVLLAVVLAVFRTKLRTLDVFSAFLLFGAAVLSVLIVLYTRSLRRAQQIQLDTEERLQEMADNIQEIVWMIDAETKKALYVNAAYETITGRSCQSLLENPSSYEDLIHPEDRVHVLTKLGEATQTGHFDERFRIVRADGEVRWVTVHGFPARDDAGRIYRLVGTAQEITALKEAEEKIAKHLASAESARAESDALSKATLALTADLRMDFVLDRLLQSLLELVPGECARVLLLEGDTQLLVAREKLRHEVPEESSGLSADPRRSRLPVPLAHIDDPEQRLACRHQKREGMAQLQGPYRHPIMAVRAIGCIPADLGASFSGPHPAKHLHSRPPSAHAVIGDTRRGGDPEFSPLRAC